MTKWCFLGLFFWCVNIKKFCFWCVWHCFKSVNNACFFPCFFGFSGVAYCCSSGFGRSRCFCVSCVFLLCVAFVSVLFALLLVLWLDVLVLFFFVFFFLFFFFGGFKGQVRWPKGPPHLALNPPYYFSLFAKLWRCKLALPSSLSLSHDGKVKKLSLALPLGGKLVKSFPHKVCYQDVGSKLLSSLSQSSRLRCWSSTGSKL